MARLALFELAKVWRRRAFLLSALALMAVNVFILWYVNLAGPSAPGLTAYKRLCTDLSGMSEEEKHAYVGRLRETIDGVAFVDNILLLRASGMGEQFAEAQLAENPGVFEKYYDLYASGAYLRYTASLTAEKAFIDGLFREEAGVYGYQAYLAEIQEQKERLGGISIFAGTGQDSFAARNIQKSAADHEKLTAQNVRWIPAKPVTLAEGGVWTDILAAALTFFFTVGLVAEDRRKGLDSTVRATRRGILPTAAGKLAALLIHCLALEAAFFTVNLAFSGVAAGWWDLSARLQSVSVYRESGLEVSLRSFLLLSAATKAVTLFAAFSLVMALCVACKSATAPYLAGAALWVGSWALWRFVPAASAASPAKVLNLFALMRTEELYGGYLNLDILGRPVSRLGLSLALAAVVLLAGAALTVCLWRRPPEPSTRTARRGRRSRFRPHGSIWRHEAYKLLITNHGLALLLAFACLIAARSLSDPPVPSSAELYVQNLMLTLEGDLTQEKEALIAAETARFDEAFEEIRQIDAAVVSGEIPEDVGDTLKAKWQAVTAFYPAFERVLDQYRLVREGTGAFLYDTGWLYLLGALGETQLPDFLLLTLGIVLALSNAGAVEFSSGAWAVLGATKAGRRGVVRRKAAVCAAASALFAAVPFVCRLIRVAGAFPLHGWLTPAGMIPLYRGLLASIPVAALAAAKLALQTACGAAVGLVVLGLSLWRRNHVQTVFFALLILIVPGVLLALGFHMAGRLSLYPIYSCHFA